eukprot:gene63814-87283_t
MAPMTETSHCSAKPVRYVLEMNQGWFAKRGLKAGFKLTGTPFGGNRLRVGGWRKPMPGALGALAQVDAGSPGGAQDRWPSLRSGFPRCSGFWPRCRTHCARFARSVQTIASEHEVEARWRAPARSPALSAASIGRPQGSRHRPVTVGGVSRRSDGHRVGVARWLPRPLSAGFSDPDPTDGPTTDGPHPAASPSNHRGVFNLPRTTV